MKCPNCAAPSGDDAAECPSCGLVFAKWRERREKEKREAEAALATLAAPSAPPLNPSVVRVVAAAVAAAWVLGIFFYVRRHPAKRLPALGVDTGQTVQFRDPKSGDMRRMRILRMGGVPTSPTAAPSPEPASEQ